MSRRAQVALVAGIRELRTLPRAELHAHLFAGMRPDTYRELTSEAGTDAPEPQGFSSFAEFRRVSAAAFSASARSPRNLQRLVRETVADAAEGGVVWMQPHFTPHAYPQIGSADEVIDLVLAAGLDEASVCGIGFGLTLAANRNEGHEKAEKIARFAARYAERGVHALALTGEDADDPVKPFAEAFRIAHEAGLTAVPHVGGLNGPESVRLSVIELGATRIAHCARAVEEPALLEFLLERGVSIDVCLSSDRVLGGYAELAGHPLPALLEAGMRCSLGTDYPLMFGTNLLREYRIARRDLGLTDAQLTDLARISVETSDAPDALKSAALERIAAWLGPAVGVRAAREREN